MRRVEAATAFEPATFDEGQWPRIQDGREGSGGSL
jgi:hypothetical protein